MTPEQEIEYAKLKRNAFIQERGRLMIAIDLAKLKAQVVTGEEQFQESELLAAESKLSVLNFEVFELGMYPLPPAA